MKIVLASGSPRRAKILKDLGVDFEVVKTDAPEVSYPADPERTVRENALAKGAVLLGRKGVLSADTIVWFSNRIYGKPRDLEEAKEFLRELAGKVHTVFTGVAFDGDVKVVRSDVFSAVLLHGHRERRRGILPARKNYHCLHAIPHSLSGSTGSPIMFS